MQHEFHPSDPFAFDIPTRGQPDRDGCIPVFYMETKRNGSKSAKANRPIFDDVAMVKVLIPGDSRTEAVFPVKDEHKRRWPAAWAAFEQGKGEVLEGTPLAEWPQLSRSQAKEIEHYKIRTVEQLASLSDQNMQDTFPGIRRLVELAKAWLVAAENGADTSALLTEVEQLKATIAARDDQIREIERKMDALQDQKPRRGPGRPRNADKVAGADLA